MKQQSLEHRDITPSVLNNQEYVGQGRSKGGIGRYLDVSLSEAVGKGC